MFSAGGALAYITHGKQYYDVVAAWVHCFGYCSRGAMPQRHLSLVARLLGALAMARLRLYKRVP